MTDKVCDQCQTTFTSKAHNARFCGTACRKKFNNLRMTRGALVYDILMKGRYDRKNWNTEDHGANWQSLACSLSRTWRESDSGAQTWTDPNEWFEEVRAHLNSTQVFRAG